MRRIVITGLGPVTPVGIGKEEFWYSLVGGRSNYNEISRFPVKSEYRTVIAAEIRDFDPSKYVKSKTRRRIDSFGVEKGGLAIYYAVAAARLAVQDSGVDFEKDDMQRAGVAVGAAVGDIALATKAKPSFHYTQYAGLGALTGCIAYEFGLHGPGMPVSTACATGNSNLEIGYDKISLDQADIMLVGSTSALLVAPHIFEDFLDDPRLSPMATRKNVGEGGIRPFDKYRDGFILGEGAGVLVLEELEHAKKRGAHIYAEIAGYGDATDTSTHFAEVTADGYRRAMRSALRMSNLHEDDFQKKRIYINAHASATKQNDREETRAVREVFGEYSGRLLIGGVKGTIAHPQEAASSMELIASALVLDRGTIPPTTGLEILDPEIKDMGFASNQFIPYKHLEDRVDIVLKNAAGFCGPYSTVVLQRYSC